MRWRLSGRPAVEHASAPRQEVRRRSGTAEAFFRTDGDDSKPVIVVHHIQKTAGTSLRRVVRLNLPPAEVEFDPTLRSVSRTRSKLLAWHRAWYESLDQDRRARLCCVMSHWAGYLLPLLDRPADALSLVREPVDRTLSYYYFKQRRRGPERPLPPLGELYERGAAGSLGKPGNELWDQLCNWQSRALLSAFHDVSALERTAGPTADADLWRARLREIVEQTYQLGVQDRFEQYVDLLAHRYGWQRIVPRSKVNALRPQERISDELGATVIAYNWLDAELYELAHRGQEQREAELRAA